MAAPPLPEIDVPRIPSVRFADSLAQSLFIMRDYNQMYMVRHQTIRPHINLPAPTPHRHQLQINLIIIVTEKRLQPTIPTLSNMMRHTTRDNSR